MIDEGYSGTHACGEAKFYNLLRVAILLQDRPYAAADLAVSQAAALADPVGQPLTERCQLLDIPS